MTLEELYPFFAAFIIGLVIGIERERSHAPNVQGLGVRSFILLAILGSIAGYLQEPLFVLITSGFVFLLLIVSYFRTTRLPKSDVGITTELSAAIIYILGYYTHYNLLISAILSGFLLLTLLGCSSLHHFSRTKLKPNEIHAAVIILIIGLGVLPFLPDHTIDPWNLFNPKKFVLLILIIAIMQFSGYVAIRLFGHRLGMLLLGFMGGLVSSTVIFFNLSNMYKYHRDQIGAIIGCGIFATLAMLLEFLVVVTFVSPSLFFIFVWPIAFMILIGSIMAFFFIRTKAKKQMIQHETTNPLEIKSVVLFSSLIITMLIIITLVQRYIGIEGSVIIALLGGLFELHSVTFASASMYLNGTFTLPETKIALSLALLGAFISKFILLALFNRNNLGLLLSGSLLIIMLVGTTILAL